MHTTHGLFNYNEHYVLCTFSFSFLDDNLTRQVQE